MAHPAARRIALENPFDDMNAIESTPSTANSPSARVEAVGREDTEVTGVRSRRCHSVLVKIHTVLYPEYTRGSCHPAFWVYLLCLLVGLFCAAIPALGIFDSLDLIPVGLMLTALISTCTSVWVLNYLTMPLCIASYVAVFVVTLICYFPDREGQPDRRIPLIVIMSVWCALIPVVIFLAWSFWNSGRGGIRSGTQQFRQTPPSQTAIELARLPREPSPAVLHPPQPLHPGLSVDRSYTRMESRPLSSVGDDGFQTVREFV